MSELPKITWDDEAPKITWDAPRNDSIDTATIGAAGMAEGLNEGLNPSKIVLGLATMGQLLSDTLRKHAPATMAPMIPTATPETAGAMRDLENFSKTTQPADFVKNIPGVGDALRLAESITGPGARTIDAAYKQTGAEKTPLREGLAGAGRIAGHAVSVMGVPGMATGAGLKSIVGATALGGAGRAVGGPIGEFIGALFGGAAPAIAASTTRGVLGGGTQRAAERAADFERNAVPGSMGQITGNYALSAAESTTGRFGAVSHMRKFGEGQAARMGERAEELAGSLSRPMDPETLGRYVRTGLTGPGGFIERSATKADKLYKDVEKYAPGNTPFVMANTIAYLDKALGNPGRSALVAAATEESTKRLGPYLEGLRTDLISGKGSVPFSDVRLTLTRVGKKIDNGIISGDITSQEAKQLYAAMSRDVEAGLASMPSPVFAAGSSPGLRAWERASGYYKARMDRLEQTIVPLVEGKTPERIVAALDRSKKEGGTTIRAVYRSLEPETRDMLTAATIRQLGRATPGAQNAEGTIFSPATFATRWDKLDDSAKRVMFDGAGRRDLRSAMDSFARTADAIKRGSTVLQNQSGTAAAVYNLAAWIGTPAGGGLLGSALAGNVGAAAGVLGSWAAANRAGHLFTSPAAVRWLAKSTRTPAAVWAAEGNAIAQRSGDPDVQAAIRDILKIGGQTPTTGTTQ